MIQRSRGHRKLAISNWTRFRRCQRKKGSRSGLFFSACPSAQVDNTSDWTLINYVLSDNGKSFFEDGKSVLLALGF
jgi:hypothetical protein